jgi:hypothetical protein
MVTSKVPAVSIPNLYGVRSIGILITRQEPTPYSVQVLSISSAVIQGIYLASTLVMDLSIPYFRTPYR